MTTADEDFPENDSVDESDSQAAAPGDELQLISDGDGLAAIGSPAVVERFLMSEGLQASALDMSGLVQTAAGAGAAMQAAGMVAEHSGRWVKMTEESYRTMKKFELMKNSKTGLEMGVVIVKGQKGGIKHLLQFTRGAGASLTNPAVLVSLGTMMNQMALQKSIDEISEYLAVIDEKVDDILRAQKDAIIADMIGVDLIIDDAMTTRKHIGRVSEVAWSKVQGTAMTIARTQAYAIRQLDAMAEKLERRDHVDDRAKLAREAATTVQQWLAILAHCFRLLDSVALLELDRVLDAAPEELDRYRLAIRENREKRIEIFAGSTNRLLERLDTAAGDANTKVLLNPISARTVVGTSNHVGAAVMDFQRALGLDGERQSVDAKRWTQAVGDVRDKIVKSGEAGVAATKDFTVDSLEAARDLGDDTLGKARSLTNRIATGIAERTKRDSKAGDDGERESDQDSERDGE